MSKKKESKKKETKRQHKFDKRMAIVSAVLFVAVIAISVVLGLYGRETLNDEYFVSDGSKIVLNLGGDEIASLGDEVEYSPEKAHIVYYYAGNKITGAKIFYEYLNDEEAKEAYGKADLTDKEWATGKSLDGKYVILQYDRDLLDNYTVDQIRESVESVENVL